MSLAVWIGGACAEIDLMRRAAAEPEAAVGTGPGLYKHALTSAHYDRVSIDVLSGASAGGLNGVLLAATLVFGAEFDDMKRLWLDVADLERLLRNADERKAKSLLRGDTYFFKKLKDALESLIPKEPGPGSLPESEHVGARLDLFLAATLLKPEMVPVHEGWSEVMLEKRQDASFHFRWRPEPGISDFGFDDELAATIHKLAKAARTTSSFPGAFEPALIKGARPSKPTFRSQVADKDDFFGVFSHPRKGGAFVVDGGVLDNIPVARAISAISDAPAAAPTDRWLLFLHPSPESQRKDDSVVEDDPGEVPNTVNTVLSSFGASAGRESLLDDIKVLEEHNKQAPLHAIFREELLARVLQSTDLLAPTSTEMQQTFARYRTQRAHMEGRTFQRVLQDPTGLLGHDPYPYDLREPLKDVRPGALDSIKENFASAFEAYSLSKVLEDAESKPVLPTPPEDRPQPATPASSPPARGGLASLGPPAFARLCRYLISTIRFLEVRVEDESNVMKLGACKAEVYRLHECSVRLEEHMWVFLCAMTQRAPKDFLGTVDWAKEAVLGRDRLMDTYHNMEPSAQQAIGELERRVLPLMESLRGEFMEVHPRYEGPGSLAEGLVAECLKVAQLIHKEDLSGLQEEASSDRMLELVVTTLGGIDIDASNVKAVVERILVWLEVLVYPISVTVRPGWQYINFLRVAGSAQSPIPAFIDFSVQDKLAGNELGNFAAFYKRSWRANDWMWGRMDAAKSLIDVTIRPERLKADFDPDAYRDELKKVICSPPELPDSRWNDADGEAWQKHFENSIWEPNLGEVVRELNALAAAGDDLPSLRCTKSVLTQRRQWEILIHELPDVALASAMDDSAKGLISRLTRSGPGNVTRPISAVRLRVAEWLVQQRGYRITRLREGSLTQAIESVRITHGDPLRVPAAMEQLLDQYRVGHETLADDIGSDRFTRIIANASVVAWNALAAGKVAALKPFGVLLRALRLFALAISRRSKWTTVIFLLLGGLSGYALFTGHKVLFFEQKVGTGIFFVVLVALFLYGLHALDKLILFAGLFFWVLYLSLSTDDRLMLVVGGSEWAELPMGWALGLGALVLWSLLSITLLARVWGRIVLIVAVALAMGIRLVMLYGLPTISWAEIRNYLTAPFPG